MIVYLVLILGFGGHAKPWGVYSGIDKAMQAQEDCAALSEPSWHEFVHGDFGSLLQEDRCVIWQWQLDGPRVGFDAQPALPQPTLPPGGLLPID